MNRRGAPWLRESLLRSSALVTACARCGVVGAALLLTAAPAAARPAAGEDPKPPVAPDAADPGDAEPGDGESDSPLGPPAEDVPQGSALSKDPLADALRATPGGWTPDRVAQRAVVVSPMVAAKQAELDAAAAKVDRALVAYVPVVQTKFSYTRMSPVENDLDLGVSIPGMDTSGFSFPVILNSWSWSTTVAVPFSDYLLRLTQAHAAASQGAQAKRLEKRAQALSTAADAKVAYLNWLRARGQRAVAAMAVEAVSAHVDDAKITLEAGLLSRADLLRLEAQLATTQNLAYAAGAFESVASEQLKTILRLRRGGQLNVGIDVLGAAPRLDPRPLPELQRLAVDSRLELRALAATKRSLQETEALVIAGYFPRFDGFVSLDYANPNQRIFPQAEQWDFTWMLGLSASWTLNETFSTIGSHGEIRANIRALDHQRQALEDGIELSVAAAYYGAVRARSAIEAARRGEEAAAESLRVRRDLFRAGKATATELTDAETALTQARLQRVDAHVDLLVALARLDYAMGIGAKPLEPEG